jgi:acyl-coenzyme A synthetase/AMP-(fatty) acid ligase/acyl carrier protein
LFVPLCWGGTVILAENVQQLPNSLAQHVHLINTVPSVLAELLTLGKLPPCAQSINLLGEPPSPSLVAQLHQDSAVDNLYEFYGTVEDTSVTTCARRSAQGPPTAGRALANKKLFILDAYQQPVPVGVPGELYVGGAGVARGYLNRPELTAQRFVPSPFSNDPAGRLFRTGDRARYRSDGQIEFLGRLDQQIKIGGLRIEPGEIETALRAHPQVRECVATSRQADSGKLELAAFVTHNNGQPLAASELRQFLAQKLPDYLVPASFIFLENLPLLPGGKVDRKRLPIQSEEPIKPVVEETHSITATEKILSEIWSEVIGLKEVGINDNFFELGGHSVLVTQIISRVRKMFHVDLNLRTVFESPTIAALAAEIEKVLIEEIEELPEGEAQQLSRNTEVTSEEMR